MFTSKKSANESSYAFTHQEIDLLSECIKRTQDYYEGLLILKSDWNKDQNEESIAYIKAKLRILDNLQERTTYIGQKTTYRE